ncbi:MAG: NAD(P)/FAD-dependent oxidoreductase [Magnetococcales bacterium]|nr:NAD(P)/FAD-dependent oxidoreductase [Magnetococcales bacterium]
MHVTIPGESPPFDAIIIGSGLGGLVAGALLAQGGKRVQLLERHDKFGGAATTFRRRDLQVEVSLCVMDGLDPQDFKTPLFAKLGLLDAVPVATAEQFFCLRHPLLGTDFVMPRGYDAAIDACTQRFGHHAKSIRTYFNTIRHLRNLRNQTLIQHFTTGNTPLSDLARIQATLAGTDPEATSPPTPPQQRDALASAQKISMGRFMQTLFGDDEAIKFALCANLQFFTSTLDHISLFDYSLSQGSYHYGAHYVRQGSQKLSDRLVEIIRKAGGEAHPRREVTRILMDQNRAVGVAHQKAPIIGSSKPVAQPDPQESFAKLILGNATPRVIRGLLPEPWREPFHRPYDNIPADLSNWTIYLGFSKPPSHYGVRHYAHFVYPAWLDSMKKMPESCAIMGLPPGSKEAPFLFCDYSQLGEMIGENGQCLGLMNWIDRLSNWQFPDEAAYQAHKQGWLAAMIDALDRAFPGIRESIVYQEMATPRTVQSYLNDPLGGVHGFGDPELMKISQTFHRGCMTAVDGLLLASSFAFGPGYSKAILTGTVAADNAFKALRRAAL